jgi:hypothetical protein
MRGDGWLGRAIALLIAAAAAGLLVWIHRHDLFPRPPAAETAAAEPDSYTSCTRARGADIDRMLAEKTIDEERAALFRSRMQAMCRAEAEKAAGAAPGAPGVGPGGLPPGMVPTRRF